MSAITPPKSKWSRMGSVMKRTSSVLTLGSRPGTPSIHSDRDPDASSLKRRQSVSESQPAPITTQPSTLAPPTPPSQHSAPSPIAESPAREAAASLEDVAPLGPSPLAQAATAASSETHGTQEASVEVPKRSLSTRSTGTSDSVSVYGKSYGGYTPPPVLESTGAGPGAFTDEPDELPETGLIRDPYDQRSIADHASTLHGAEQQPEPAQEPEPESKTLPEPEHKSEPESKPEPKPESKSEPAPLVPTAPATPEEIPNITNPGAYFDLPTSQPIAEPKPVAVDPHAAFKDYIRESTMDMEPDSSEQGTPATVPDTPEPVNTEATRGLPDSDSELRHTVMPVFVTPPNQQLPPLPMAFPSYDVSSDNEVWGGSSSKSAQETRGTNGDANRSRAPSSTVPTTRAIDDPFSDPVAPRITVSQPDAPQMPFPQHQPSHSPTESHEEVHNTVVMPLPAFHDVVPNHASRGFDPSGSTSHYDRDTDETRPLLDNSRKMSYLSNPANPRYVTVSPQSGIIQQRQPTEATPHLHTLGWIEYFLPDATVYYVHPTQNVTTDIDLRSTKKLDTVTAYLEHHKDAAGMGTETEMWLRDAGSSKRGFMPVRCWVDHKKRSVMVDPQDAHRTGRPANDDRLDMEFRYWSFMEAHPAHTTLPTNSRIEAMDVLTWAWTDRLLPSNRHVPAPFSQEECQELMSLLRLFGDGQGDTGIQTVVHTRIVSRILLRVAQWRQQNFRPNKPLPQDVSKHGLRLPDHRRPFRRALFDLLISCLCLGIPYIFFERTQYQRLDEESGMRSAGPMLIVGACTCLVAAIVLSASVTFLSLPGLDSIARVAGIVAILFASFSMASTLVALFRYKADMERAVSYIGGEGLMMLSSRSVVMSLPLVFLAYSIIGFVIGIAVYSFRGVTVADARLVEQRFDEYTKWTVVGVLGGLAGILTTSLLVIRR